MLRRLVTHALVTITLLCWGGTGTIAHAQDAKVGVKASLLFGFSVEGEYGITDSLSVYGEYGATLYQGYQLGIRWYPRERLSGPMIGVLHGNVRDNSNGPGSTTQLEFGYTLTVSDSTYVSGSVGILNTGRSMPQLSVGMLF